MPRSTHTKSRNGCDQCKRRRVKCNEQGPPCNHCATRELPCTYSGLPNRRVPSAASTPASAARSPIRPTTTATKTGDPNAAGQFTLSDLGLMHQFSTSTYKSLCNDPSDHHAWQFIVPQKALEYDFLLNGMLAIAALHRAVEAEVEAASTPTTSASTRSPATVTIAAPTPAAMAYIDTALQYHNGAFAPFQQALGNITPMNCEAVFAHSIITTVISIALPQLTGTDTTATTTTLPTNPDSVAETKGSTDSAGAGPGMTENMIVIFELLQGVKRIFNISQPFLKARLFTRRHDFIRDPACDTSANLDPKTQSAFSKLSALNEILASFDPEQHRINTEAISLLRRCFSRYASSGEPSAALTWISAVGKDFVSCLRRRQPFPLLVLMHWGVLLGELNGSMWWARGSGRALVMELLVALPETVFRWDGAQLWPKERFGL